MEKERILEDILDSEWEDAFQNIQIQQENPYIRGFFQYKDNQIFNQTSNDKSPENINPTQSTLKSQCSNSQEIQMISQNSSTSNQTTIKKQNAQASNSKNSKDSKNERQQMYSKVYRQKMKQKYKNLWDQNAFLKKRINQLQSKIRQQELQLNRLKYSSPEKQITIDEFSKQCILASEKWYQQLKNIPPHYFQKLYLNDSQFHQYLVNFWAQRGFAGKKKIKILNYHFNQILQSILKDSEKYLCLVYANSKSYDNLIPPPEFQAINNAHKQIYKPEGDLWHKLKQFNVFLHPMSLQLNRHISQFYKKYEEILSCCNKIHEFLRKTYRTNMNVGKRRLQMERWFDFYKYGKSVRKLRYQWFNWMKSLAQKDEQQTKQEKKNIRKKRNLQ